jgi:hypothetical protein
MGRRLACASSTSPAAVVREPVMSLVACHWMEISLLVIDIEPSLFFMEGEEWIPMYQTSAAYVKAGIATML